MYFSEERKKKKINLPGIHKYLKWRKKDSKTIHSFVFSLNIFSEYRKREQKLKKHNKSVIDFFCRYHILNVEFDDGKILGISYTMNMKMTFSSLSASVFA